MVEMTPYDLTKGRITLDFRPCSSVVDSTLKGMCRKCDLPRPPPSTTAHRYFLLIC